MSDISIENGSNGTISGTEARVRAGRRLLARIPAEIAVTLDTIQRAAIADAAYEEPRTDLKGYHLSVRWLGRVYFVRLIVGEERRHLTRPMRDQQINLGPTIVLVCLSVWMMTSVALVLCFSVLYLIKSASGIDFFAGPSLFHNCFFD